MTSTPPDAPDDDEAPLELPAPPPPARRTGRPTLLTPEVRRIVLEALRMGARREAAARLAGISPATLSHWMHREDEPYLAFAAEVEQVEGGVEVKATGLLLKASLKSPQWAAWWLEHKFPVEWGRRRVELTGKDGERLAPSIDPSKLTDAELADLRARLRRSGPPDDPTG